MLRTKLIQCVSVVLLLAGCVPSNDAPAVTNTPIRIMPTKEIVLTVIPTSTPPPTPIPVIQECVSISPKPSSDLTKGVLVLRGEKTTGYVDGQAIDNVIGYLFDLESKSYRYISPPGKLARLDDVSPDRTKILYSYIQQGDDATYRMVIADFMGNTLADFKEINQLEGQQLDYYFWLNNQALRTGGKDYMNGRVMLGILNPFTNEYKILKNDWENYYGKEGADWFVDTEAVQLGIYNGANIIYNSTLTRVIYPQSDGQIALADVATEKILGVYQPPQPGGNQLPLWGRLPRWSNSGENLLIIFSEYPTRPQDSDEFYLVSQDGTFQRFTQLTQLYDTVRITEYAWAPNGEKVAFWLNTVAGEFNEEKPLSSLAILDMKTRQVTNLCIQGISAYPVINDPNIIVPPRHPEFRPIWSPDGKQIMITQPDPNNADGYNVVIVDLETKTAWIVDSNKHPIGWMVDELK